MRRQLAGWRARLRSLGDRWDVVRDEWAVERELERIVSGSGHILVGPWISEVGYEVLYWVPFLRWLSAAYRIPAERFIVMSRGGTASWYGPLAAQYVEVFDHVSAADLANEAAAGRLKQREISALDRRLIAAATSALGLGEVRVLHPSVMFRWFAPFWSGHEGTGFVDRHTRFTNIAAPDVLVPASLPEEYVAVKLYTARALPDGPVVRTQLEGLVAALAERWPVVLLDTGLALDDHADYAVTRSARIISLSGRLDPRINLAVQTRIIAGARLFVGTCGSLAWLAPMLGVATVPVFTDDSFLHAHLHVARRAYERLAAARFSPVDLSGVLDAGLTITSGERAPAGARMFGHP
jgi:hypothetical protein